MDYIYKTEGSKNDANDGSTKDHSVNDDRDKDESDNKGGGWEEESFEIEEEIQDINRLLKLSNKAIILDQKLPDSQKELNSHLKDLSKDPNVKEFFEGKTPNARDLPELHKALEEAKQDKMKELSEAKRNSYLELFTRYIRDPLNSNNPESNKTFNKGDCHNYSDFKYMDSKPGKSLLDYIIEILKEIF